MADKPSQNARYGLVLEGGGSRGAFQIGALRALKELGITIGGVTGTSIGAINGAFIVQGDLERAHELWYNISPSKVFDVDDQLLNDLKNWDFNPKNLSYFMQKLKGMMNNRGLDTSFMRRILEENINEGQLRKSKVKFGMVTVSLTDIKPLELFLEDIPPGKVIAYLMASASLPVFKLDKLDGKHFLDGGFFDNLPIRLLASKGYKDIITVRTHSLGVIRKVNDESLKITSIDPSEDLGGILDFNQDSARKNLELGYYDTFKVYQGLKGKEYYIEPVNDEMYFIKHLLELGEKKIKKAGEVLGFNPLPYRRLLFEYIVPKLAEILDLETEGHYEDVVVGLHEKLAKIVGLNRFKVYKFEDFCQEITKLLNQRPQLLNQNRVVENIPRLLKQSDLVTMVFKENLLEDVVRIFYC